MRLNSQLHIRERWKPVSLFQHTPSHLCKLTNLIYKLYPCHFPISGSPFKLITLALYPYHYSFIQNTRTLPSSFITYTQPLTILMYKTYIQQLNITIYISLSYSPTYKALNHPWLTVLFENTHTTAFTFLSYHHYPTQPFTIITK